MQQIKQLRLHLAEGARDPQNEYRHVERETARAIEDLLRHILAQDIRITRLTREVQYYKDKGV